MAAELIQFRVPHIDQLGVVTAWGPLRSGTVTREYPDGWLDIEIKLSYEERVAHKAKTGKWVEKRNFYIMREWIK